MTWQRAGEVALIVAVCVLMLAGFAALAWLTKFPALYD